MKLFLLSQSPGESDKDLVLKDDDFHYLCHVRRLEAGNFIQAKDREGRGYLLKLVEISKESCRFSIEQRMDRTNSQDCEISLFQALPKGKKMDLVVRQATESGVKTIIPVESDHSLIKFPKAGDRSAKRERWARIVREALQQSGSSVITEIQEPQSFSVLKDFTDRGGIGFFCHQVPREEGMISPVLQAEYTPSTPIGIVIGPEGGLSDKEVDNLEKWGYHSLYFGDNVLRTETASLYGVSAIKTVIRELF